MIAVGPAGPRPATGGPVGSGHDVAPRRTDARVAAKALGCSAATNNRRVDAGALEAVDINSPGGKRPVRRIKRESLEALPKPI